LFSTAFVSHAITIRKRTALNLRRLLLTYARYRFANICHTGRNPSILSCISKPHIIHAYAKKQAPGCTSLCAPASNSPCVEIHLPVISTFSSLMSFRTGILSPSLVDRIFPILPELLRFFALIIPSFYYIARSERLISASNGWRRMEEKL